MNNLSGRGQLTGVIRSGGGGGGGSEVIINPSGAAIGTMEKISVDGDIYEVRNVPDATSASNGDVLTRSASGIGWYPPTKELPVFTSSDNNKVLAIDGDTLTWKTIPKELPSVSSGNNGDVLTINNGSPVWAPAGGGYKTEKIFDGNVTTAGNITLTKSIDNYDELIFVTNFKNIPSESYIRTFNVDVSIFKNIGNYAATRGVLLNDWSRDTRFAQVKYVDNTTIDVEAIQIVSIVEIYGVKH